MVLKSKLTLILLSILVFLLLVLLTLLIISHKNLIITFWKESSFTPKSSAEVFLDGEKVRLNFKIIAEDRAKSLEFAGRLGASKDWLSQGIALDLDKESELKLKELLPLKLSINFEGKKLSFKNSSLLSLRSSLPGERIDFATGSAKFSLRSANIEDFDLKAIEPKQLMEYATSSEIISLSKKVYGVFPILGNIAKMEMSVSGKNISGEILLK